MDESIKWLDKRDKDKPFMLMTHFKATHEPFDYPDRFKNLFVGKLYQNLNLYLIFILESQVELLKDKYLKYLLSVGPKQHRQKVIDTLVYHLTLRVWILFKLEKKHIKNLSKIF